MSQSNTKLQHPERLEMLDEHDPEWQVDAACWDLGIDGFFPERGEKPERKRMCNGGPVDDNHPFPTEPCPVKHECDGWALENRIRFGIAGGTTAQQRIQIMRKSGKADMGL